MEKERWERAAGLVPLSVWIRNVLDAAAEGGGVGPGFSSGGGSNPSLASPPAVAADSQPRDPSAREVKVEDDRPAWQKRLDENARGGSDVAA